MAKDLRTMFRKWMSYRAARITLRDYGIKSRKQYWDWWDKEKPRALPKYPDRVYEEWVSWSDYLGCQKVSFYNYTGKGGQRRSKIKVRPFYEALRYVHAQGLKNYGEYYKAYIEKKLPEDLPIDPNKHYEEWVSWPHWLGKELTGKVESAVAELGILAICIPNNMPGGFIQPLIEKNGWIALRDRVMKMGNLQVIKMYQWKSEYVTKLNDILARHGRSHEDDMWLVSNIHELTYSLDQHFDWFRPPA